MTRASAPRKQAPPSAQDDGSHQTPDTTSNLQTSKGTKASDTKKSSSDLKDVDESAGVDPKGSGDESGNGEDEEGDAEEDQNENENDDDDTEEDGEDEDEEDEDEDEDDEDEDEEEDEEPRLKYARLTQHLGPVYRNGDATSSFLVAGDKMIVGTHNGNIHVIQLPTFQTLRVYHAHSASVTNISISPYPPPLPSDAAKPDNSSRLAPQSGAGGSLRSVTKHADAPSPAASSRRSREPPAVPSTPSNNIHIATSSMDGNVCVQGLIDMRDVQLRNFARPVQAVAVSPDFKNDRTYLSGGLAGQLILTVGAPTGRSTSTTVGTAAATASGWLGSVGLGGNTGKDTVLHSGEGTVSSIKWSLSGKYVAWLNEHGIKIMRTNLHLDSADSEDAWKRIGHIDRPQTEEWDTMASVWKGRVEWIDEQTVQTDDGEPVSTTDSSASTATARLQQSAGAGVKGVERLTVGWGGTIWIIHVHPGGIGTGKHAGEKSLGRAEIAKHLRMDCIISGISLYTKDLLLVLANPIPDDDDDTEGDDGDDDEPPKHRGHKSRPSTASASSEPSGGIRKPQNRLPPELRLIDLVSQSEIDKDDGLIVSRYERLSSGDYHLDVLPARNAASAVASSKGAFGSLAGLGTDMWNAAINPKSLFSSGASIKSRNSGDDGSSIQGQNTVGSLRGAAGRSGVTQPVHPNLLQPGSKIFIHSPYDCILATRRDLGDHLTWLLEKHEYQKAWELLDEHPEIMASPPENLGELVPPTPDKKSGSNDEFIDDTSSVVESIAGGKASHSNTEKEKRRIGELWIRDLIDADDWTTAGKVCGKVLGASDRWEKWVWTFAGANKFQEIAYEIPAEPLQPPLSRAIYEVVLNHYIQADKLRFKELLSRWPSDLFDVGTITTALENQLSYRDVRKDSVEGGERGRDWRIVMESLAKLHEANGRYRESLKCYMELQDADSTFRLIRENHLADAVADDIPRFIGLRVPADKLASMSDDEIEEATSEAITLLVDEAQHGLVRPSTVIKQLEQRELNLYLYFYLRGLYKGDGIEEHIGENQERLREESKFLVDDFADLAVRIFAKFDRVLLMDFLKSSTSYAFEKAAQECERYRFDDELVYLYSKTGQTKRALFLIIDRLHDVKKAIEFAKEQDDPDLWEDLLTYSMDKPSFIRGLLEQVGTAINPITLVRRIPEGLEIEGLREGLKHIMKEHEIQYSISSGVARVLRSEVAAAQNELRLGQRKGIKFEVVVQGAAHVDVEAKDVPNPPVNAEELAVDLMKGDTNESEEDTPPSSKRRVQAGSKHPAAANQNDTGPVRAGHCAECREAFTELETQTLTGFACGHVFHLSHLLERLYPGRKQDMDHGADLADRPGHGRRVGPKVTHARLLKNRIRDGCPVCVGEAKKVVV